MSRSKRKFEFCSWSRAGACKWWKRKCNSKLRHAVKQAIKRSDEVLPHIREVSNIYDSPNDDKSCYFGLHKYEHIGRLYLCSWETPEQEYIERLAMYKKNMRK